MRTAMQSFPALALSTLPLTLVPLLVAALCAVASIQQQSPALRLLSLASVATALGLPPLLTAPAEPVRLAATACLLLAASFYWLAIERMVRRRTSLVWVLAAPLAWLGCCLVPSLLPMGASAARGWATGETLFALVIDDALSLLCILVLLGPRQRSLSHQCMLGVVAMQPVATGLCAASRLWPDWLPIDVWSGRVLLAVILARIVLWPGLAMMTVMEMATRREREQALHDELSGLLNRRGFWRQAEALAPRALLLFDIDHFKRVNDTFGHAAGDAVIRRFGQVLTQILGGSAVVGRVGGEEFAAAFAGDAATARARAEQVRIVFADSERALGGTATVSVGIAATWREPLRLSDQMATADRALYRAKRLGRNRVALDQVQEEHVPIDANAPRFGQRPGNR